MSVNMKQTALIVASMFASLLLAFISAFGQPQTDTIKICKGISIPEGYTIIGEATTSDCPKGAYILKKSNDNEVGMIEQALSKARNEPNNFEAQKQAGETFYLIQRWDEAITFWIRANQLRPDDYDTIVDIGNAYFDAGRYEQAAQWYSDALIKNPDDVNVRTDLGTTFMARTPPDFDLAIKEYRRSLETNPNYEQAVHNLIIAYIKKGQIREAREMLKRLEQINPKNPDILTIRSQISDNESKTKRIRSNRTRRQ